MDQKKLILAIAISLAILFGFQALMPRHPAPTTAANTPAATTPATGTPQTAANTPATPPGAAGKPADAAAHTVHENVPANVPRLPIGKRLQAHCAADAQRTTDAAMRDPAAPSP